MSNSLFESNDDQQPRSAEPSSASPTDSPRAQTSGSIPAETPVDPTLAAAQAYLAGGTRPVSLNIESRLGDSAMRSLAASHVLNGKTAGIGDAARFVTDYYERVHKDIVDREDIAQQRLRTHLRELDDEVRSCKTEMESLRTVHTAVDESLRNAREELPGVVAEFRKVACKLRQERLANFSQDMKAVEEINRLREQNVIDQVKSQIYLEHEIRKTFLDAARAQWKDNETEYGNRKKELESEQSRADNELNRLLKHIQGLRSVGVTRNVTGFLFWTGTLTVAAAAGFLAETINKHTGNESQVNRVLQGLRTLIVGTGEPALFRLVTGLVGNTRRSCRPCDRSRLDFRKVHHSQDI